mmetsp:Transcript_13416/g.31464  ORF Transcript_13416/g.31464 Transcript_13416/m.31464 type:complete len:235 (+) Transcript_13416:318-1022(+)
MPREVAAAQRALRPARDEHGTHARLRVCRGLSLLCNRAAPRHSHVAFAGHGLEQIARRHPVRRRRFARHVQDQHHVFLCVVASDRREVPMSGQADGCAVEVHDDVGGGGCVFARCFELAPELLEPCDLLQAAARERVGVCAFAASLGSKVNDVDFRALRVRVLALQNLRCVPAPHTLPCVFRIMPQGVENHCHAAQGVVCPLRALGDMVLCQIKVVLHGTQCHCFLKQRLPLAG